MSKTIKKAGDTGRGSVEPATSDDDRPEPSESLMQAVLARPLGKSANRDALQAPVTGVVIGNLAEFANSGKPVVTYPGMPGQDPVPAVAATRVGEADAGRRVALSFEGGDPARPVILGLIHETSREGQSGTKRPDEAIVDDERLTLSADKEIVLKCGKSSITLTRAGKIIIKGAYLSNHSTGVNRIKGGSVQIN